MTYNLALRLKRLRQTEVSRGLVQETHLHVQQFIAPLFINERLQEKREIKSMPGQFQLSLNDLGQEIEELTNLGIHSVLLFGIPICKDDLGSASYDSNGIIQQAIGKIREINKDMHIITDVCFCEYTNHGHCGILDGECIDNDKTLELLAKQAVSHAEAGANWVAPSSMTDGMVAAIRQALDNAGHINTAILSYAVKYSSSFYGPFREAAEGAPKFGDRRSYQMDPANANEAYREAALDLAEGADMLMVKPAQNYLDIIFRIKQRFQEVPLCAYQISGEYSLIKHGAAQGLINEKQAIVETLMAIKRAGADFTISYFAKDIARFLKDEII
ncbi:porphobilinogen synthase [Legionella jordanis]|uniref:Delta-aminolevulinic acid dehydratase n=1 Tax=Legionella jordanis TaxID=456 RepID=A0A0W0V9H3_9GAMM|nr:delta-aminolevulinic acid dehydratases (porphobilinogen synthase) [Legionella jordanis]RMX03932.1 porphobilinogen synthase [Legionella jordanis]RMX22000.1 porphobilinogen synthase [Legionella jordanis]VEH12014.1 delta-aminolevulinic acid dehydratases (porphobilinogen synthase) [Legionella jordanis]HAT8712683.1 porphobilinogen synthase [Legionella jordanis]